MSKPRTPEQKARQNERERAWRAANPEKARERRAKYKAKRPAYQRAYYARHREKEHERRNQTRKEKRKNDPAWAENERRVQRESVRRWKAIPGNLEKYRAMHRKIAAKNRSRRLADMRPADLIVRVYEAISLRLPSHKRDEIAGEMMLEVYEKTLLVDDIEKRAKEFERRYNRTFDGYKTLSLDAPLPGGKGTFVDLLEGGL